MAFRIQPVAALTSLALALLITGCTGEQAGNTPLQGSAGPDTSWPHWGNDEGGSRFAQLEDINPDNVHRLRQAWEYHTGDLDPESFPDPFNAPAMQATPILAGDSLFLCSPRNRVIALDPATGAERWHTDTNPDIRGLYSVSCRGVAFHHDPDAAPDQACAGRVIAGTLDGRLLALDARTGERCPDFGTHGEIDLKAELGEVRQGEYAMTSAPTVVNDRIVVGAQVADLRRAGVPSGVVRGFDVRSGEKVWSWEAVPPGHDQSQGYTPGSPNAWAPFSADSERGLVFIPTGNPTGDYYGGEREGMDFYGSSIVALDTSTGRLIWHYRTVHNDVWDYDVPSQPVLFDFPGTHGPVPALVQTTKMGLLFVLNRETGEPLFPVEERPVPQGGPAPYALSPTQPFPVLPEPIHPDTLTEDDMFGFVWFDRQACVKEFRELNYAGRYTPIGTEPTLVYPGFMGGSNWGSVSYDPQRNLLIANTTRVPAVIELVPREVVDAPGFSQPVERQEGTPYAVKRRPFLSPLGAPCNRPPWGVLTAVDMNTGKKAWEVPLGSTRDLAPFPLWLNIGVPNSGGSLLTAGGLTFIGATTDSYLRAFATASGDELWKARLPAGGHATPMSYRYQGRQYVVIAAGGHKHLGSTMGDSVVAFALQ